jgi:hypothetical protein
MEFFIFSQWYSQGPHITVYLVPDNRKLFLYTSSHESETTTLPCQEKLNTSDAMILLHISEEQRPQASCILRNHE